MHKSNPEMSRDVVNQKTQAVNTAHQNLYGQQKLEQAQSSANTEIGNLPNLTNTQKAKEKELVNSKQTRTEVQEQLNQAKSLDSSMGTLKSLVAKQPTVQKQVFILTKINLSNLPTMIPLQWDKL